MYRQVHTAYNLSRIQYRYSTSSTRRPNRLASRSRARPWAGSHRQESPPPTSTTLYVQSRKVLLEWRVGLPPQRDHSAGSRLACTHHRHRYCIAVGRARADS